MHDFYCFDAADPERVPILATNTMSHGKLAIKVNVVECRGAMLVQPAPQRMRQLICYRKKSRLEHTSLRC